MKKIVRSSRWVAGLFSMVGVLLVGTTQLFAQNTAHEEIGVPHDWSHRHLVFSNPGTAAEAIEKGKYGEWLKITGEPRYQMQRIKREAAAKANVSPGQLPRPVELGAEAEAPEDSEDATLETNERGGRSELVPRFPRKPRGIPLRSSLVTDWSVSLGTGGTVGEGMFPAEFSLDSSGTTANCGSAARPDFVVFNTSLRGTATQASIIAFDNLYSGCTGIVPSTYWAYNTGAAIPTSVVLSSDGSQVAFVQISTGDHANFVVLKWKASTGTLGAPVTPGACPTLPCMTSVVFSGSPPPNDTRSSIYYDYLNDIAYVGDNTGKLHKFTGVFKGTLAEAGAPWPVSLSAQALSSPVFDPVSGNVFVGDYNTSGSCGGGTCGFLYSVNASTGAVIKSSQLDFTNGLVDAPLVDATAGMVYAFVGANQASLSSLCGPAGVSTQCSQVSQFATNFTSTAPGTPAILRGGAGSGFILAGTFDNAYFTSSSASSPTGHLYLIGDTGADDNTLFQIPITSNSMGTPVTGPALSNNHSSHAVNNVQGENVSEVFTGSKDYIFTSVLEWGVPTGMCASSASNGCVQGFDVTSGTISSGTAPTGASPTAGGASGIIIDNLGTSLAGTGNIYFSTLTGGNAIQISQTAP